MNISTTTLKPNITTPAISIQDILFLYFKNPVKVIRIYQIAYSITLLIGLFGNIASLLTFSRPTLRTISTGCLFIALAISDLSFLFASVFDVIEIGYQVQFWKHLDYTYLCRFRVFIMNGSQFISSWILVMVSIDRWIRTRFPFKSNSLCTPKKALLAVGVLLLISIGLHAHILTPIFGALIPGFAIYACGPSIYDVQYFMFYILQWTIIQICLVCILPATLMIIILIDIMISVRLRKRAVVQPNQTAQSNQNGNRQSALQKQMFILMFASICIFLITSLPVGIYKIVTPRNGSITSALFQVVTIWTVFGWFQSLFYTTGFYIHCLSSSFFRKEFRKQIIQMWYDPNRVQIMTLTKTELKNNTGNMSVKY